MENSNTALSFQQKDLDNCFFYYWLFLVLGLPTCGIGFIVSAIFSLMLIYKLWSLIPEDKRQYSPGLYIGLLFVPFFSIYWYFRCYWDLGRALKLESGSPDATLEKFPLTFCILSCCSTVIYILGAIFSFAELPGDFLFNFLNIPIGITMLIFFILFLKKFKDTGKAILGRQAVLEE